MNQTELGGNQLKQVKSERKDKQSNITYHKKPYESYYFFYFLQYKQEETS